MLKRAFTLIEIVVVLAIASLIMLVVFLAVTGSQRSQRDQFRKDTANRVLSAAQAYRGNNGGTIVTNAAALASYVDAVDNGTDIVITANGVTVKLDASASPAQPACSSADTPSAATVVFVPSSGSSGDAAFVCLESAAGAYKAGN